MTHKGEKTKNYYMVFIDLEKVYDKVPRKVLKWVLMRKGIPKTYSNVVLDMYEGVCISVKSISG